MTSAGGDGELTGFLGKGGAVARRESPGFLELRVLSPSVQDQPLFSEKELMESRAQGLVMGGEERAILVFRFGLSQQACTHFGLLFLADLVHPCRPSSSVQRFL